MYSHDEEKSSFGRVMGCGFCTDKKTPRLRLQPQYLILIKSKVSKVAPRAPCGHSYIPLLLRTKYGRNSLFFGPIYQVTVELRNSTRCERVSNLFSLDALFFAGKNDGG
jgi:hypothetical protein